MQEVQREASAGLAAAETKVRPRGAAWLGEQSAAFSKFGGEIERLAAAERKVRPSVVAGLLGDVPHS